MDKRDEYNGQKRDCLWWDRIVRSVRKAIPFSGCTVELVREFIFADRNGDAHDAWLEVADESAIVSWCVSELREILVEKENLEDAQVV